MRETSIRHNITINAEAEADYKKIYLDNDEEYEIIPTIAPPSCKESSLYFGRAK